MSKYATLRSLPGITIRPVGGWLSPAYVERRCAALDAEVAVADASTRAEVVRRAAAFVGVMHDARKYGPDWFAAEEPWR